ncbi:MAG: tRNA (adenosine(37)-N6)-threonylcarbamoyltransferase complex dimerization subunit type 1 TsaB [Planctomycetota bacterium]|jgi:tRNA threonylcarbamoyladenosine biosynthesis protein TsaB|nr:tRNA (adenosine(37)-N6)-threonylcarbamoyltransferase complex dimerization subunit type 1 TsaB [Planctomycetota bacterium]MDP6940727.1 tRNA (adenosine(37)-N6)-threonylcarbamoyltransferase complex dimerization subunit type 1 TsaB [Planctomycetota bacterium]
MTEAKAVLAIEASGDAPSLALSWNGSIAEADMDGQRGKAMVPAIDALLQSENCPKKQLGKIIVGVGPGSYTGLRIACSVARTLSWALDIPVEGVCSFEAAALDTRQGSNVHVLLDAYRKEFYHSNYLRTESGIEVLQEPHILQASELEASIPETSILLSDGTPCESKAETYPLKPRACRLLDLSSSRPPVPLYLRE